MSKPSIKCSRCDETFSAGFDYRMHFDKHMDEWYESEDRAEYIKTTTMHKHERKKEESLEEWINRISIKRSRWFHVIKLDYFNRMIRFGFGFNNGNPFIRIDLWWVGFRISKD